MNPSPKFSILLPVFNGTNHLESCLASVLQQTEKSFELLVSDDGSTDGSLRLVQSFTDPRVRLLQGPRKGLFPNLNFLAREARGEFIRILCQDDRLQAGCLEREQRFFSKHPLVSITFCKATRVDTEGHLLSQGELNDLPEILSPDLSQQHFFYHGCIPGNLSTVCFRRELLKKFGHFDESYRVSGDYEYWARVCEKEFLGVIQERLVDLRVHGQQLSRQSTSLPQFVVENRRIRKRVLKLLPPAVRGRAAVYESRRHDVIDLHTGLRALLDGRLGIGLRILMRFSPLRFLRAAFHWAWTGNNRWYRPQAPWVLSCPWDGGHPLSSTRQAA